MSGLKLTITSLRAVIEAVRVGYFLIIRTFTDGLGVSESISKGVGKPSSDSFTVADSDSKTFGKSLSDGIDVTDDVNGAVIGDDQTAQFGKRIRDSAAFVDAVTKAFSRAFSENVPISDAHSIAFSGGFSDSLGSADVHIISLTKNVANSAILTDSNVIDFAKVRNEQLGLADSQERAIAKSLSDTIFATDDSNGAAVGDDQLANFFKNLTHLVNISENQTAQFTKVASDDGVVADSGTIVNQGYCDISYFAEDYVGVSRTF